MKFTQEIKDKWLEALKSGEYTQGYRNLVGINKDGIRVFCPLAVLGDVTEGLLPSKYDRETSPYIFLCRTIGEEAKLKITSENDSYIEGWKEGITRRPKDYKDDYSNVIPLIEALEVQE